LPQVREKRAGPKPREKVFTPIPRERARRKCPSSWKKMRKAKTRIVARIPSMGVSLT
jgi:hypothetical protein